MDTPTVISRSHVYAEKARETGLFAVLTPQSSNSIARFGVLRASGRDAESFVHGQVTNEVKELQPGEGNLSARVNRTGRLTHLFSVHRVPAGGGRPEYFLLLVDGGGVAGLKEDLESYLFSEDVELTDLSRDYRIALVQGPSSPLLVEREFGDALNGGWAKLTDNAVRPLSGPRAPFNSLGLARSLTGDPGYFLLLADSDPKTDALCEKLAEAAESQGFAVPETESLQDTLDTLRVESGWPRVGSDVMPGERTLPETGLEQTIVSYSKGCYLGQEVIARIRTYGSPLNALRGLIIRGGEAGGAEWWDILANLPESGADLLMEDGQKIGSIASRVYSPHKKAPVALAYLDRSHRTPGTELNLQGTTGAFCAQVALLPFYEAPDRKARAVWDYDRAVQAFSSHEDDRAIALLEEALRLDPSYADAYEVLGVILGRAERYHEAIELFKRLEEVAPNEPLVHTNLSLYYMKLGDKEKAEAEKGKATMKQFGKVVAEKDLERQRREAEEQRLNEARRKKEMFQEVLEFDPEDAIALFGLGNAHAVLGEYDEADRAYVKARDSQKDNSALFLAHGKVLEKLGRQGDAVAAYRDGMDVASRKGDLMPLKEMEHRLAALEAGHFRLSTKGEEGRAAKE